MDSFLIRHALENDRRGLGSTYVAVAEGTNQILGYVTLCSNSVHFENVPTKDLPHYPIPAVLIARLAVHRSSQRMGVGTGLMLMALRLAVEVSDRLGVFAVTVEAMNEEAKTFYQKRFGFTELLDDPHHLFVTVADLQASGLRPG
ncbi:MAG: GNAT family N-acetyltransferase [Thermodesulfobacteriota bacterium]